ncbi:MAG TPA: hypothetical protein QGI39_01120 [Gammaproteobacteria bacterium]|nr:hypothetical protein [Gammaproteobacteria bacterium]
MRCQIIGALDNGQYDTGLLAIKQSVSKHLPIHAEYRIWRAILTSKEF